jgi:hypothetical protein
VVGRVVTMSRLAAFSVFLLLAIQAQGQMFSHGVPAGATSPEPDGRQHGIPSNVQSPTPVPPGVHVFRTFNLHGPLRRFGNPRDHRKVIVPVPVFYPIYGYADGYPADPYVQQSFDQTPAQTDNAQQANAQERSSDTSNGDDALRQAYLQGARDALRETLAKDRDDSRYGDHYMDSREQQRPRAADEQRAARERRDSDQPAAAPAPPNEDNSPATVFVFKDGHQLETKNFAIMGQTLYDFSGPVLKKVQISDLDKDATTKANDDRGTSVKLP